MCVQVRDQTFIQKHRLKRIALKTANSHNEIFKQLEVSAVISTLVKLNRMKSMIMRATIILFTLHSRTNSVLLNAMKISLTKTCLSRHSQHSRQITKNSHFIKKSMNTLLIKSKPKIHSYWTTFKKRMQRLLNPFRKKIPASQLLISKILALNQLQQKKWLVLTRPASLSASRMFLTIFLLPLPIHKLNLKNKSVTIARTLNLSMQLYKMRMIGFAKDSNQCLICCNNLIKKESFSGGQMMPRQITWKEEQSIYRQRGSELSS